MDHLYVLIPIVAMIALFGSIVLIVKYVIDYRRTVRELESGGGEDFRRLAEEAVRAQRELLEAVRATNETMQEIERLLKEV